jgi:hypothetical protein
MIVSQKFKAARIKFNEDKSVGKLLYSKSIEACKDRNFSF